MQHIVYTMPDRTVKVVAPAARWMTGLRNGGGLMGCWIDRVCIEDTTRRFLDTQIERKAGRMGVDAARRFVMSSAFGGCTTAEAYDVIADADARPYGTAAELIDAADLPSRWFRAAWRRSREGGPIWIDFEAAKQLQAEYIANAVTLWNKDAECEDLAQSLLRPTNGPPIIELDRAAMRRRFAEVRSMAQLQCVWPADLPVSRRIVSLRRKETPPMARQSERVAA
jgi:hypothetical protein